MQCSGFLEYSKSIPTATIPVIKITIDLVKLMEHMKEKLDSELNSEVRSLKIDITFEDESQTVIDPTLQHNGVKCVDLIK